MTWNYFNAVIVVLIVINIIQLTLSVKSDSDELNNFPEWLEWLTEDVQILISYIFSVLYTIEALVIIISKGFVMNKDSYLRDSWQIIDFVMVICGFLEFIPALKYKNLMTIKVVRLLKVARMMKHIPSLKMLLDSLSKSVADLLNVIIFLLFIFFLFGILGTQLFIGAFYNRCRSTSEPDMQRQIWPIDDSADHLCGIGLANSYECPAGSYCGTITDYDLPADGENMSSSAALFYGNVNFNHIGTSMFAIFHVLTLEGWADIMYRVRFLHANIIFSCQSLIPL